MPAIFSHASFRPLLFTLKLSETSFHFRLTCARERQNCCIWVSLDSINCWWLWDRVPSLPLTLAFYPIIKKNNTSDSLFSVPWCQVCVRQQEECLTKRMYVQWTLMGVVTLSSKNPVSISSPLEMCENYPHLSTSGHTRYYMMHTYLWDKSLLGCWGWPRTQYLPASAPQVPGWQVCAITSVFWKQCCDFCQSNSRRWKRSWSPWWTICLALRP